MATIKRTANSETLTPTLAVNIIAGLGADDPLFDVGNGHDRSDDRLDHDKPIGGAANDVPTDGEVAGRRDSSAVQPFNIFRPF